MTMATISPLNKFKIIALFTLVSAGQCYANTFEWSIQITNPDFELKHIVLPEAKEYKPFMELTSWRCWFSETSQKNEIHVKTVRCNYSSKKTGIFTSYLSCSPSRPRNESKFDLIDEKKDLKFNVLFSCRKK